MAFNTLEYLEAGKVDFVYRLSMYDNTSLINSIRESERRDNIIDGFLPLLLKRLPYFCFNVIYDNPKYEHEAQYALNRCYKFDKLPKEIFIKILYETTYGIKYFKKHYDEALKLYYNDLDFLIEYIFNNYEVFKNKLKELALSKDMHIRFKFMSHLIQHKPELFKHYYKDLTKYLIDYNYKKNEQLTFLPTLMSSKDISELAFNIFESPLKEELYPQIKKFIALNYDENELAYYLTRKKEQLIEQKGESKVYRLVPNNTGVNEFNNSPDWYFSTLSKNILWVYRNYSQNISKELLEKYQRLLNYFYTKNGDIHRNYEKIDYYGLSKVLEEYVTKYLDLSKSDEHYYIEDGSTASVFRIGDYVFKLDHSKWSFEDVICPDLYIILPNLEEIFIRDDKGIVEAGIEVQKYLSRDAKDVPWDIWDKFKKELAKLGYYSTDTFMNGPCGDNCRLLDSYKDSGNSKPPKWFKKYPIVIVDRDRIYRKENIYPKQLRSHY